MNTTVPKAELLERERRWMRPAGIAALVGVALYVAAIVVQQSATSSGSDTDAQRLIDIHDHSGALLIGSILQGLSFLAFAVPLVFLFYAAAGRTELVRRQFVIFAVVGPVLLFASSIVRAVGLIDAADQFDKELPRLERETRQAERAKAAEQPGAPGGARERQAQESGGGGAATAPEGGRQGESAAGTTATGATDTATTDGSGEEDESESEDEEENTPKEDRAEDLVKDSGMLSLGSYLTLPGLLGLMVSLVYVPLWAMRTGLLTRFWATLGMALGVALILLPFAQLGLVMWFAVIGLMILGTWPGPRPPAWDAGEAIPWPKPGESPPETPSGPVEGSGREVSERPLPEEPPDAEGRPEPAVGPDGLTQGQRRKKRKRRD